MGDPPLVPHLFHGYRVLHGLRLGHVLQRPLLPRQRGGRPRVCCGRGCLRLTHLLPQLNNLFMKQNKCEGVWNEPSTDTSIIFPSTPKHNRLVPAAAHGS